MLVVPAGVVTVVGGVVLVVGVTLVVVVAVLGVVVAGGEVNVGPPDAGMPALPALFRCGFGAVGAAECRVTGLALVTGIVAAAGCGAGLA